MGATCNQRALQLHLLGLQVPDLGCAGNCRCCLESWVEKKRSEAMVQPYMAMVPTCARSGTAPRHSCIASATLNVGTAVAPLTYCTQTAPSTSLALPTSPPRGSRRCHPALRAYPFACLSPAPLHTLMHTFGSRSSSSSLCSPSSSSSASLRGLTPWWGDKGR